MRGCGFEGGAQNKSKRRKQFTRHPRGGWSGRCSESGAAPAEMVRGVRGLRVGTRKVDVRLPGKGNSNFRGARPVHKIILMIKWIWTSRLSIKNSLELAWSEIEQVFEQVASLSHAKCL